MEKDLDESLSLARTGPPSLGVPPSETWSTRLVVPSQPARVDAETSESKQESLSAFSYTLVRASQDTVRQNCMSPTNPIRFVRAAFWSLFKSQLLFT